MNDRETLRQAVRLLAFHLPQFHPVPENDEWWGKGFTEWTNVARARPFFPGHYQPRVPADLGFYDLRLPEARASQAELARSYGIEGFCYWHYWFHGRRLLERPVDEILASGEPDFPFCLAWANDSWSRAWQGKARTILIEQTYSEEDDRAHGRWLARAFADPRYVRVNGRPLMLVYRPLGLPDARRTIAIFAEECDRAGVPEPYMVGIDLHNPSTDMRTLGLDMTEHHEPQIKLVHLRRRRRALFENALHGQLSTTRKIARYPMLVGKMAKIRPAYDHFPCCFTGWDNSPRWGRNGTVMTGSTPEAFRKVLRDVALPVLGKPWEERIVFINAWNEWAEGMYLEPDQRHGRGYLEAVASVLEEATAAIAVEIPGQDR